MSSIRLQEIKEFIDAEIECNCKEVHNGYIDTIMIIMVNNALVM